MKAKAQNIDEPQNQPLLIADVIASAVFIKDIKKAIEDARFVFPNACETKIVVTMNARSLMNFFKHRCCNRAQWEIQNLAIEMLKLVREESPTLFKHAGPSCLTKPCPEGKMTCGEIDEVRKKFKTL
jgi:thymidylate synthase (FAD)